MFGKDNAIQDPAAAPNYFVDYREKLDPAVRWTDRIYPDGTWHANLFQFYSRVWPRLAASLPTPFVIEGGIRKDDSEAHVALREAFVNAIIHADYAAIGGVVIEREPDRIKMENPGTLLVSFEQYQRGGVSDCRNKALQRMFMMIGGGEQAGSGAARIRIGWQSRSWRSPWIEVFSEPDRIRLNLPMVSLIPDQVLFDLRSRFGTKIEALSADELQALATAKLENAVSNARLRSLTTLHSSDITKLLQGLCEQGLLTADGYGRWTNYHLPQTTTADNQKIRTQPDRWVGSSGPLGSNSGPLESSSGPLESSSGPLAGDTLWGGIDPNGLGLPSDEERQLRAIAESIASKGKAPKGDVERVVVELCSGRFLTTDQLSNLLNRSGEKLRKDYLSPLVESGQLRYRYPDSPNSPNQAYTAGILD
jgi:ATP-dependent DNA helicase RecG